MEARTEGREGKYIAGARNGERGEGGRDGESRGWWGRERGWRELRGKGGGRRGGVEGGVSCCRTFFPHVPNHSSRVILENSSLYAIADSAISHVLSVNP